VVVWVALVATGAPGGDAVLPGIQAFALAAAVAAGLPKVRDAILGPIRWIGDGAFLVLLLAALVGAPPIDVVTVGAAAGALVLGTSVAMAVARLTGRDPRSALIGSGTRDPGVAVALAAATGSGAVGVPLVYAGLLALGTAAVIARSRARGRPTPRSGGSPG